MVSLGDSGCLGLQVVFRCGYGKALCRTTPSARLSFKDRRGLQRLIAVKDARDLARCGDRAAAVEEVVVRRRLLLFLGR